ncbi:melanoma antigen recognized by T-cells 1 [Hyperolius riggenbachi]|uniref:melanoma antigen recognized by T-cells 1 n=1 Tax=Hyperolius riggenbachi TaxID=752182 RepID=UPI0035A3234F
MPHSDSSRGGLGAYSSGRGGPHRLSGEETAGIAILVLVIALVLIIGCWYFKKRSGYKILRTQQFHPSSAIRAMMGGSQKTQECKVPLQDYNTLNNVIPGAPPAYEKVSAENQPPPYTP